MKLIFAIVQNDDSRRLIKELNRSSIYVTRISSSGGFLHGGNSTLMIGIEADKLEDALGIIKANSRTRKEFMVVPPSMPLYADNSPAPVEVTIGGATVFVLDVAENHKF